MRIFSQTFANHRNIAIKVKNLFWFEVEKKFKFFFQFKCDLDFRRNVCADLHGVPPDLIDAGKRITGRKKNLTNQVKFLPAHG